MFTPVTKENLTEEIKAQVLADLEHEEAEEQERQYIQKRVDAKFSDMEQSTLWMCMNDKNDELIHNRLNPIVRKHMSSVVPVELYRGITRLEANRIYDLKEDDEFALDRVTSFSSDFATARFFAGQVHYNSNIILSIRNCPWAYNYQEDMIQILLGAPDEEFMGQMEVKEQREDKMRMVEDECEFMLPKEATFRIVEIDSYQKDPNDVLSEVYHLELVSW